MCDYCTKSKPITLQNQEDTNISEIFIDKGKLFIKQSKWYVDLETHELAVNNMVGYATVEIENCPFCGKEFHPKKPPVKKPPAKKASK